MTAPTGTLLTAPTAINELYNTCAFKISDIDETSLKVYMVGIILSTSFAAIALIIVSVLTCSVGRCVKSKLPMIADRGVLT
jgi:heme/copper-type cytochrome/quinol oxidase subunit 4